MSLQSSEAERALAAHYRVSARAKHTARNRTLRARIAAAPGPNEWLISQARRIRGVPAGTWAIMLAMVWKYFSQGA